MSLLGFGCRNIYIYICIYVYIQDPQGSPNAENYPATSRCFGALGVSAVYVGKLVVVLSGSWDKKGM